jgi:Fe2+ transport system protein FeoA
MHRAQEKPASPTAFLHSDGTCSLDSVPADGRAEVVDVLGDHGTVRRLSQLGVVAGATLHVRGAAPLGGPLLVDVAGSSVAVGRKLARRVFVRMLP